MGRSGIHDADSAMAEVMRMVRGRLANAGLEHDETWPLPRCLDVQVRLAGSRAPLLSIHAVFNQDGAQGGVMLPGERLLAGLPHASGGGARLEPVRERSFRTSYRPGGFDGFLGMVDRELGRHVAMSPSYDGWALSPAERELRDAVVESNRENGPEETLRTLASFAMRHANETGTFLPRNESPLRFVMRRSRETGDASILSEALEEFAPQEPALAMSA